MKAKRLTVISLLGLLCLAPALCAEAEDTASLPDAIGIKEIVSATVIHSPKGFRSQDGRTTSYVTNRATLGPLLKLLSDFPSKGGLYKMWPGDIVHWRVYIHGKNQKIVAINVYGYSLQSPLDATFSPSGSDPKNSKLMTLLKAMLKSTKEG